MNLFILDGEDVTNSLSPVFCFFTVHLSVIDPISQALGVGQRQRTSWVCKSNPNQADLYLHLGANLIILLVVY